MTPERKSEIAAYIRAASLEFHEHIHERYKAGLPDDGNLSDYTACTMMLGLTAEAMKRPDGCKKLFETFKPEFQKLCADGAREFAQRNKE